MLTSSQRYIILFVCWRFVSFMGKW